VTENLQDLPWSSRSALEGSGDVATVSARGERDGVTLAEREAGSVLHVIARRGQSAQVRNAIGAAIGSDVPAEPRHTSGSAGAALWSGPGQWLVLCNARSGMLDTLSASLNSLAAVIDQSAARVLIEASGPEVRRALAKVIGLDLHPAVFAIGHAAMTDFAHVPVHLWRSADTGDHAVFVLAVPRSYARSLWHTLVAAGAEYGLEARSLAPSR
jgi:methylglutamate dehydrogenase subunit D